MIHITRKHPDSNAEPVLTSLKKTNISFGGNASDESVRKTSFGRGPKGEEGNNVLDTMNETIGKMIKFRRQLDELVPESRCFDPFNCFVPPSGSQPIELGQAFFDWLCSNDFTPETDPCGHLILGFESYVCSQCLVHMPLSFYGTRGTNRIIRSYHRCNQKRLIEVKSLSDEERDVEMFRLRIAAPDKMHEAIKHWCTKNNSPYVNAVKLQSVPNNSNDFTSYVTGDHDWLRSVMKGTRLLLDDNQLKKFLFLTGGKTYVSFSIMIKQGDSEITESYFMTLSKERCPHVVFYVENPEIAALQVPRCLSIAGDFTLYSQEEKT
jgi:hypothetical protein